ncbi:MAG: RNA 2',3'-cyclic phosphodiesterase [Rhodocyclaceae bacterium]|nr:RNA 2',3'-cyclic phosphodiesterase [Rhodocyclaceae bacterium]MBK6675468.1 RNA 2',3'-cyclic phosphodiesterase [Rhodocyclaceae bacterium]MBK9311203.1 RNA 2',3'-cyclic phosphodiesterase [Rhodocyclaceae bacterium]
MPRIFFAVWPDAAAAGVLHGLAANARESCGGRLMRRETLHLTLAFLGAVSRERLAEVKRVADGIRVDAFELNLDRLGYWKHNRILWAGGVSPRLTLLADALAGGLCAADFRLEARPFVAHLTLLREARCAETPSLNEPVVWPVREFVLAQSRDGRYDIIGRWPLATSGSHRPVSRE